MSKEESIAELEKRLVSKKSWAYGGETHASARPEGSLMEADIEFDTSVFNVPFSKDQNEELLRYVARRYKEKTFDNHEFKEVKEPVIEDLFKVEACETNKEILSMYEKIEKELLRLTDYGNDGFK